MDVLEHPKTLSGAPLEVQSCLDGVISFRLADLLYESHTSRVVHDGNMLAERTVLRARRRPDGPALRGHRPRAIHLHLCVDGGAQVLYPILHCEIVGQRRAPRTCPPGEKAADAEALATKSARADSYYLASMYSSVSILAVSDSAIYRV